MPLEQLVGWLASKHGTMSFNGDKVILIITCATGELTASWSWASGMPYDPQQGALAHTTLSRQLGESNGTNVASND